MKSTWIDIDENLPTSKNGMSNVLAVREIDDKRSVISCYYLDNFGFIDLRSGNTIKNIIYWMPFPEPPRRKKKKKRGS